MIHLGQIVPCVCSMLRRLMRVMSVLQSESEKLEKHDAQLKEMEELYNKSSAEYEVINKELMTSKTEFTAFERKDIKYREDIKHTKVGACFWC